MCVSNYTLALPADAGLFSASACLGMAKLWDNTPIQPFWRHHV
jgi:hypothetical protein